MKNICLTLALLLSLTINLSAHNNEPAPSSRIINGRVLDKETGEALAGVKIQVKGTDTFCYTDLNGNYILMLQAKPEAEIEIDLIGYTPLIVKSNDTSLNQDLVISAR